MPIKRFEYIDAFRGLAIIFIVFGHIPLYCYGESGGNLTSYRLFTSMIQIPMFFFISGFLFVNNSYSGGVILKIRKKFRQLVIPALIFCRIFILFSSGDIIDCLNDRFKYGYWFTLTLFEFFLLQYTVDRIWNLMKKNYCESGFVLFNIMMAILAYGMSLPAVEHKIQDIPVLNWLGLPQWRYYMYFVMGRLLQLHIERIIQWKYRDVVVAIIITVFFILAVLEWGLHWTAKGAFFHLTLISFETCALLSVFALFYKHRDKFGEKSVLGLRWLSFIGKRTLDIYMLHYFFLPKDMTIVGEYFSKHSDMVGEMIVSGVMALAVIAVCIVVGEMIRVSKIFSCWVLGTK